MVDEEISKTFDTTIIETDRQGHLLKKDYLNDPLYGMCWIQNSTSKKHSEFLEKYPIDDAIQKIGKDRGYDFIMDAVSGALVYAIDSHDLTDEIIDELRKNSIENNEE